MITFTSLGGNALRLDHGTGALLVFADEEKPQDETLIMRSTPEESPTKGILSWPGEYDFDGVAIMGIGHEEGRLISYVVSVNGVRCAFLCSPLQEWADHELELLGDVDVLCIPSDDPKILQKLVDEIDPRVLIPLKTGGDEKYTEALKICGAIGVEQVSEYILKGALPAEGREVVVLQ